MFRADMIGKLKGRCKRMNEKIEWVRRMQKGEGKLFLFSKASCVCTCARASMCVCVFA